MSALNDGWQVLWAHSTEVFVLLGFVLLGGALMLRAIRWNTGTAASLAEQVSLAAALWTVPALFFSALALVAARWAGREQAAVWLAVACGLVAVAVVLRHAWHPDSVQLPGQTSGSAVTAILVGATLVLVLLRLAFVHGLLLPQYFDSATHYGLVRQVLNWVEQTAAPGRGIVFPGTPYYHLGLHILLAGIALTADLNLGALMLVSGQIALALTPLALFGLAHRLSESATAALIAVTFAAAGWYMPAYAANWGKYPALLSLLPALGGLALLVMAASTSDGADARRPFWVLALLVVAAAGIIHTRSLTVILAAIAAGYLSARLWQLAAIPRRISIVALLGALIALGWAVLTVPALSAAFEPYHGSGLAPTLAVVLLGVPAFKFKPRASLGICLFLVFLLVGLITPIPVPGLGSLLDRPMVEMWIFVPLSLLGAVGFAGLVTDIGPIWRRVAALVLASALVIHALAAYDFRPSSCCTIVMPDDIVAIDWLGRNAKPEGSVAIATEMMQLGAGPYQVLEAPVDAGAWIYPLTGLEAVPMPFDVEFSQPRVYEALCARGVRYIYVGGSGRGFDAQPAPEQSARFAARLELPGASIVQILGCAE